MRKIPQRPKKLWNEWQASMAIHGPGLWQKRCGMCLGGPHGSKDARKLAKFLIDYAKWVEYHENKRKKQRKEYVEYYEPIYKRFK